MPETSRRHPLTRPATHQAPAAGPSRSRKTMTDGRVQALIYMQPSGVLELKRAVLDGEADSMSHAVVEAVNNWLIDHRRPPLA